MINPLYTKTGMFIAIREIFHKDTGIQLQSFFEEKTYQVLNQQLKKKKLTKHHVPGHYSHYAQRYKNALLFRELQKFLKQLTGKTYKLQQATHYCFKHRDYSVLQDKNKEKTGIRMLIDFTSSWPEDAGGYHSYIQKNEEIMRVLPQKNALTLIKTTKDIHRFVKYLNLHSRRKERRFLELIYHL